MPYSPSSLSETALPNSFPSDEVFVNSCCHRCNGSAPYELEAWQGGDDDDDDDEPSGNIVTRALHAHTYTHRGREVRGRFSAISFGLNTCYLSSCSALSASTNRNERKLDTMTARAWQLTTPHTAEVWRQLSSISLSLSLYSLAFDGYQCIWHSWNCVTLRIPKQSAKINWCDVKPLGKFK